ncbi:Hypothetical Protein FCC1311_003372 [Hondaea fermentalgiana]|uniref:Uncharacterized protein n=1 Tax=Hondaea fermentalgiana TaxID=2315210 RepID=A0A2R5G1E7_9STRA|nr:Hypothetical Protein FCC1311_003372 [Hondaea fermentalgiana]|eukprot:GBG24119.1 Hypothetical Protein FCC1311_003372 [Hondaea fermentalgiana]
MKAGLHVAATAAPLLLLLLLLAALSQETRAQLDACGDGTSQLLAQANTRCSLMNVPSPLLSTDTCCGTASSGGSQGSSTLVNECRDIYTNAAYCTSDCESLDENDELVIYLEMESTTADDTCCRSCKCVGDPDCMAFDGTRASWVLCDGRAKGCKMKEKICLKQVDHLGNACQWLKDDESWESFDLSGSPCQPDFALSGYPTMTMYSKGDFLVNLTLGERGIIRELTVADGSGETYALGAASCFQYDPRTVSGFNQISKAWTASSGSIPRTWTVSTPNDVEILWRVVDDDTGIVIEAACTQAPGSSTQRIDVQRLYAVSSSDLSTDEETGFCVSGTIDRGLASIKYSGTDDFAFQQKCLAKSLPELLSTCKAIIGLECTPYSLNSYIRYWCENADIANTDLDGDVDACYQNLVTSGSSEERASKWVMYLCQLNHVDDVESCMTLVSQFGWTEFLSKYSNGIISSEDTDGGTDSCAADASSYTTLTGDDALCALGVFVEYEVDDGDWEQAFFIPSTLPPCQSTLVVNGADYPELFLYPIRFRQCSLDASCLRETGCAPSAGFSVQLEFSTDECEAELESNECFDAQCAMDSDLLTNPQVVCGDTPSSPAEIGACESCCVTDSLVNGDAIDELSCRELITQIPFCDATSDQELCDTLLEESSNAMLTMQIAKNTTNMDCCRSCAAWGDPLISSFSGEKSKWINCDGRNSKCTIKESVCLSQVDHAGNQCVYSQEAADLLLKPSDIGAYGSPCQSNVTLSGEAVLTMYAIDGLSVSITNGERSVITRLHLQTELDTFHLDASECFADNPNDAWSSEGGAKLSASTLDVVFADGDSENEKTWTIVDANTNVFIRARCIRKVATDGFTGGYRMNIETLIDTEPERTGGSGFCVSGAMDTGLSTINSAGEICQENIESLVDFCQAVGSNTCQSKDVSKVVKAWCDSAANIFPLDPKSSDACFAYIKPSRSNSNKVLHAWQELYCEAVSSYRSTGQSVAAWVEQCVSRLQNDGFDAVVAEYGKGSMTSSASVYCAQSASDYGMKADSDPCMPGVTVEYRNDDGDWAELFFIPEDLPPCNGELQISAMEFPELFVHPFRVYQCELDTSTCPVDMHEDIYCAARQGFSVSYLYSYESSICTTGSSR